MYGDSEFIVWVVHQYFHTSPNGIIGMVMVNVGCEIGSKESPRPWNAKGIRRNMDGLVNKGLTHPSKNHLMTSLLKKKR